MQWSVVLLSVLGLTASSPVGASKIEEPFLHGDIIRNDALENLLREFIEGLRQKMLSGGDTIPVLDPLSLLLNDVKISKLSTFLVQSLKVHGIGLGYQVAFDFEVPVIEFEASQYELHLTLDDILLYGKGDAKIFLIKPRISGHIVAKLIVGFPSLHLHLEEVHIKLSLEEFHPNINGLFIGDEDVSDTINTYLKHFVPEAVKLYERGPDMQLSLVLLSILGLTLSSPVNNKAIEETLLRVGVTPRNAALENALRGLLEDLRQIMLTGSGVIPVLDPLQIPSINTDGDLLNGLTLSLNDLKVSKLSTFSVEELNVQLAIIALRLTLDFNIQVPVLEVEAGQYDLRLWISGFTLFGRGDARINIIRPALSGNVVATLFGEGEGLYLRLQEVRIIFSIAEFDSHITGLLGGDENVGSFLNAFLNYFVPNVVRLYEEEITNTVSGLVLVIGNTFLADFNIIDILG
ncbi:unnamed protein product [Arctia plantaginis]|uniref:Uncharacterized protein n=1 Tax=Arctia plantaginis TaxID=874455 RepID=A0A8S1AFK6_ARCPL|nr:unnamed protein product [Arctia plantaginis]